MWSYRQRRRYKAKVPTAGALAISDFPARQSCGVVASPYGQGALRRDRASDQRGISFLRSSRPSIVGSANFGHFIPCPNWPCPVRSGPPRLIVRLGGDYVGLPPNSAEATSLLVGALLERPMLAQSVNEANKNRERKAAPPPVKESIHPHSSIEVSMRLPKFRLRTSIIAVAAIAVVTAGTLEHLRLRRPSYKYRHMA